MTEALMDAPAETRLLDAKAILAFTRSHDELDVPEWGDDATVRVQTLTAYEVSQYESSMFKFETDEDGKIKTEMRMEGADIRLCELALVDSAGARLFQDGDLMTANAPAGGFKRIARFVRERNGLGKHAAETAEGN